VKLFWLPRARADVSSAIAYIASEDPRVALEQLDEIERQTDRLIEYPELGRMGRRAGTRELSIVRTPFVLVYRLRPRLRRIEILRLLHSRQKWPPS
jgi:toxin ParE1/3/4